MGEIKDTFKHAAIYSFSGVLGRMISFFMLPFYAHILQSEGYGVIGIIDATLALLMSLFAYGVQGNITRFYHEEAGENKRKVISTALWMVAVATFVIVAVLMVVSKPLSNFILGNQSYHKYMILALLAFFFDLVGQAAGTILLIERRSIQFSLISLLRLFTGLFFNIYLIIGLKMGLLGYFWAFLATTFLSGIIQIVIAVRMCGLTYDRRIARNIINYQVPLLPGNIIAFVGRQIERFMVRFQIGLDSVGILEMGYKFPALLAMLVSDPFMRSWNTKRTEIAEEPDAPVRIGRTFTYYVFLATFTGLVMAIDIRDVLELLTPPEFWYAYRIAWVEIVTTILAGCHLHVRFGLYYAKDTKTMSWIRSVTSLFKIALAYVLIRIWGLYGAAYSACITAAIMLIWTNYRSQKYYRLVYEKGIIACMAAAAIAIFILGIQLDVDNLAIAKTLNGSVFPGIEQSLRGTFLGTWKDGKVVQLLAERTELVTHLVIRTAISLSFLAFMPFVHIETRRRLAGRVRAAGRRPGRTSGA